MDPEREAYLGEHTVGELTPLREPIRIADSDPAWPTQFQLEAAKIRGALGEQVLLLEHVGSTSVPGLPAKPVLDILLAVADSANEPAYAAPLEQAGYPLRIREPGWHEHRMFRGSDPAVNLHVFSAGCPEIGRMLLFRDWLRRNDADCELYAQSKRTLAQQQWKYTQAYADAKTAVVEQILAKAG